MKWPLTSLLSLRRFEQLGPGVLNLIPWALNIISQVLEISWVLNIFSRVVNILSQVFDMYNILSVQRIILCILSQVLDMFSLRTSDHIPGLCHCWLKISVNNSSNGYQCIWNNAMVLEICNILYVSVYFPMVWGYLCTPSWAASTGRFWWAPIDTKQKPEKNNGSNSTELLSWHQSKFKKKVWTYDWIPLKCQPLLRCFTMQVILYLHSIRFIFYLLSWTVSLTLTHHVSFTYIDDGG